MVTRFKHVFSMKLWVLFAAIAATTALRCYEGTVDLDSNLRTKEKDCGISNYCVQKINRATKKTTRECASFTDEHNMEEKCPMSGCHWQSKSETYCCCQFDLCNEYKADGNQFHESEMQKAGEGSPSVKTPEKETKPTRTSESRKTTQKPRDRSEVELDE